MVQPVPSRDQAVLYVVEQIDLPVKTWVIVVWVPIEDLQVREYDARSFSMSGQVMTV
jgi:hypothetical protein